MGSYTESVSSTGVRETYILSPPSDEATSLRLNSQISSKMAVPSDWQTMQMQPAKKTGYGSGRIPILVFTAESESVKVERFKHPFTSGNPIDEFKYVENKMKHLLKYTTEG